MGADCLAFSGAVDDNQIGNREESLIKLHLNNNGKRNSILQTEPSKNPCQNQYLSRVSPFWYLLNGGGTGNSENVLLNRNIVNGLIMFNIMDGQYCILGQQKPDSRLNTSDMILKIETLRPSILHI